MDDIHLSAYVPPQLRGKSSRQLANEQWKDLPDAIILNEDVKEIKAKKQAAEKKMNKKGMERKAKAKKEKILTKEHREEIEEKIYGDVRKAMAELVKYLRTSGELDKYWNKVEQQNENARKEARRVEKDRRKIEMGDEYQSSDEDDSKLIVVDQTEDSWDQSSEESSAEEEEFQSEEQQSVLGFLDMKSPAAQVEGVKIKKGPLYVSENEALANSPEL